jgi:RNA polymerase sigma factor (sigma-70 family)
MGSLLLPSGCIACQAPRQPIITRTPWRFIATGRPPAASARSGPWLSQIVRRAGIDARRAANAQRRRPEGPLLALHAGGDASTGAGIQPPAGDPTPSANVRRDEESELVQAALAQLADDDSRKLLRLVFMQGQSLRQAAEEMGLTYDQARHRYHAALGELQEALARWE